MQFGAPPNIAVDSAVIGDLGKLLSAKTFKVIWRYWRHVWHMFKLRNEQYLAKPSKGGGAKLKGLLNVSQLRRYFLAGVQKHKIRVPGIDVTERESRLMGRLADWMQAHGRVLSDRQRSNAYTGVRIREIEWRGRTYRIVDVDGMTCQIERL